jgi:hypothetical protein
MIREDSLLTNVKDIIPLRLKEALKKGDSLPEEQRIEFFRKASLAVKRSGTRQKITDLNKIRCN